MYFRSLSLLATFACAGLTIIAPLGASDLTNLLGNFASGVSTPTFTDPSPCDGPPRASRGSQGSRIKG